MTAILEFLQSTGVLVLGLLARLLVFAAILASVMVPIVAAHAVWQWARRLRKRRQGAAFPAA